MMAAFLDSLGIAHEDGLISDEELAAPDAEKLKVAASELTGKFPADDVSLYLATLVSQDPETWQGSGGPARDEVAYDGIVRAPRTAHPASRIPHPASGIAHRAPRTDHNDRTSTENAAHEPSIPQAPPNAAAAAGPVREQPQFVLVQKRL